MFFRTIGELGPGGQFAFSLLKLFQIVLKLLDFLFKQAYHPASAFPYGIQEIVDLLFDLLFPFASAVSLILSFWSFVTRILMTMVLWDFAISQ